MKETSFTPSFTSVLASSALLKALAAGIAQAYGHHPLTHHPGQRQQVGVAAQITAAADCYLVGYARPCTSGPPRISTAFERLEAWIALHNGARAVVTALLKGHAVLAAEGLHPFYSFEVAVAAKALAVQARPSSDVGKYLHGRIGLGQRVNRFWSRELIEPPITAMDFVILETFLRTQLISKNIYNKIKYLRLKNRLLVGKQYIHP